MITSPEQTVSDLALEAVKLEVAAGSVPGRRHLGCGNLLGGRNNQDALVVATLPGVTVAAVFDGCGSASDSELGAKLAASVLPAVIQKIVSEDPSLDSPEFWQKVRDEMLERLRTIAQLSTALSGDVERDRQLYQQFLRQHFLFTMLGACITDKYVVIFGCGDGVYQLNRRLVTLGPFEDNAPPYLAYGLMGHRAPVGIGIHEVISANELDELLLGTDGLTDLISAEHRCIPGKTKTVGNINKLWSFDPVFVELNCGDKPMEALTGWLRQLNSEVVRLREDEDQQLCLIRDQGLLPDDTTIIALRRRR